MAIALARGRLDGMTLTDVKDVLVTTPWNTPKEVPGLASKIVFGKDGTPPSPFRAWPSTPATSSRSGRTTCSSEPWPTPTWNG